MKSLDIVQPNHDSIVQANKWENESLLTLGGKAGYPFP